MITYFLIGGKHKINENGEKQNRYYILKETLSVAIKSKCENEKRADFNLELYGVH